MVCDLYSTTSPIRTLRTRIVYDPDMHDFAMSLDGDLIGFARTYQEAEDTLDTLIFSILTHPHDTPADDVPPAPLDCADLAATFQHTPHAALAQISALNAAQRDAQAIAYAGWLNDQRGTAYTAPDVLADWRGCTVATHLPTAERIIPCVS